MLSIRITGRLESSDASATVPSPQTPETEYPLTSEILEIGNTLTYLSVQKPALPNYR